MTTDGRFLGHLRLLRLLCRLLKGPAALPARRPTSPSTSANATTPPCIYVCMYMYAYVCMCACVYVFIHTHSVFIHTHTYTNMYTYTLLLPRRQHPSLAPPSAFPPLPVSRVQLQHACVRYAKCLRVCVCVCMCVCVCVCARAHTHTHTHTYTHTHTHVGTWHSGRTHAGAERGKPGGGEKRKGGLGRGVVVAGAVVYMYTCLCMCVCV